MSTFSEHKIRVKCHNVVPNGARERMYTFYRVLRDGVTRRYDMFEKKKQTILEFRCAGVCVCVFSFYFSFTDKLAETKLVRIVGTC